MIIDGYFFNTLCNISFYTTFVPLGAALYNYKYIGKPLKPIFLFVITAIVVEVITGILNWMGLNNFFLFHLFTIAEFSLFSLFYFNFFKRYFNSSWILIGIFIFMCIAFFDYKVNGLESMDDFSVSIECVILVLYSLFLFYYVFQKLIFERLTEEPVFWINSSVLLYFAGNLLLFVFSNDLLKTDIKKHLLLWGIIHSFCNMVFNLFLTIGFWKTRTR